MADTQPPLDRLWLALLALPPADAAAPEMAPRAPLQASRFEVTAEQATIHDVISGPATLEGFVVAWALYDSPSAGTVVAWAPLATPVVMLTGEQLQIDQLVIDGPALRPLVRALIGIDLPEPPAVEGAA